MDVDPHQISLPWLEIATFSWGSAPLVGCTGSCTRPVAAVEIAPTWVGVLTSYRSGYGSGFHGDGRIVRVPGYCNYGYCFTIDFMLTKFLMFPFVFAGLAPLGRGITPDNRFCLAVCQDSDEQP